MGLVGNAKVYHYKAKRKASYNSTLLLRTVLTDLQEFIDVTSYQRRRRKQLLAKNGEESKQDQGTLYHINMYWVGCAEEDIITIVSDGVHHNLGLFSYCFHRNLHELMSTLQTQLI